MATQDVQEIGGKMPKKKTITAAEVTGAFKAAGAIVEHDRPIPEHLRKRIAQPLANGRSRDVVDAVIAGEDDDELLELHKKLRAGVSAPGS